MGAIAENFPGGNIINGLGRLVWKTFAFNGENEGWGVHLFCVSMPIRLYRGCIQYAISKVHLLLGILSKYIFNCT